VSRDTIFKQTDVPSWHRRNPLARAALWWTWSEAFLEFVALLPDSVLRRRVFIAEIEGCAPYGDTYFLPLDSLSQQECGEFMRFATTLLSFSCRELCFFRHLLDPPFCSGQLHVVLALLRTALVRLAGDQRAALYSPVTTKRVDHGFRLHSDLFITTRVWLTFDAVPNDQTGASTFLSSRDLMTIIRSTRQVPSKIADYISTVMRRPIGRDSFDKLYRVLHSDENRWHEPLQCALQENMNMIRLRRGEGYLIDDRRWLHGRTAVSGKVGSKRFRRLTYGIRYA
jgi:hypothetical protein